MFWGVLAIIFLQRYDIMHKMILTRPSIFHQKATTEEISLKDLFYCYTIHASSVIDYLYVGCLHHNFDEKCLDALSSFYAWYRYIDIYSIVIPIRVNGHRNMLELDIKMFVRVNMIYENLLNVIYDSRTIEALWGY